MQGDNGENEEIVRITGATKMNRITIFCFYNPTGTVYSYVRKLLADLQSISDRILFVANGSLSEEGKALVSSYTKEIYVRENLGLDYGAYRYALKDILGESVYSYDELILCNDTFFGFFEPLDRIFDQMDPEDLDIWAMNIVNRRLLGHLQSYFLVIKLRNRAFIEEIFRYELPAKDYSRCVAFMEPRLLRVAKEMSIRYGAYAHAYGDGHEVYGDPLGCFEKCRLPIMKKKCMDAGYCSEEELDKAIQWIAENADYPIQCIIDYRLATSDIDGKLKKVAPKTVPEARISEEELQEWANQGDFYIYGAGIIAQSLYYTYFTENSHFKGFVVSNKDENPKGCLALDEISKDARIVTGVRAELQQEIAACVPQSMHFLKIWEDGLE